MWNDKYLILKSKKHCCPNGYTCDTKDGRCNKGDISIPFYKKVAATKRVEKSPQTLCPGGLVDCNDDSTCCQLPSGQYGCCLLSDAICCSDQRTLFFQCLLLYVFVYFFY